MPNLNFDTLKHIKIMGYSLQIRLNQKLSAILVIAVLLVATIPSYSNFASAETGIVTGMTDSKVISLNPSTLIKYLDLNTYLPSASAASTFTAVANGNWNNPATWGGTVPASSDNKIIPSGIIVTINNPVPNYGSITNNGVISITSVGALNNGGTISNSATINNAGTISNNFTITINSGGKIFNSGKITVSNTGGIGISINPGGAITNTLGALISVANAGTAYNTGIGDSGAISNQGNITISNTGRTAGISILASGVINNQGKITISNTGTYGLVLDVAVSTLNNNSGGQITISNTIGTIDGSYGIDNRGIINNRSTGIITILTSSTNGPIFGIINEVGSTLNNNSGGRITITNIQGYGIDNKSGTNLNNSGTINNNSKTGINNEGGNISNSGRINNNPGAQLINSGAVTNKLGAIINLSGGSTLANSGTTTNNSGATISEHCTSIITGNAIVNSGTINTPCP